MNMVDKVREGFAEKVFEQVKDFVENGSPDEVKAVIEFLRGRHTNVISKFNENDGKTK